MRFFNPFKHKKPETLKSMQKRAAMWENFEPDNLHSIRDLSDDGETMALEWMGDHLIAGQLVTTLDGDAFVVMGAKAAFESDWDVADADWEPPEWTAAEAERMKRIHQAEL